ncbi:MAG: hypothetical protein WAM66_13420 [Acidobacteriaceae bacterium]
MGSNVGYNSSVYRPAPFAETMSSARCRRRFINDLKFHGTCLGFVLTIFGAIHFFM